MEIRLFHFKIAILTKEKQRLWFFFLRKHRNSYAIQVNDDDIFSVKVSNSRGDEDSEKRKTNIR